MSDPKTFEEFRTWKPTVGDYPEFTESDVEGAFRAGGRGRARDLLERIRKTVETDHILAMPRGKEFETGREWCRRRLFIYLEDLGLELDYEKEQEGKT